MPRLRGEAVHARTRTRREALIALADEKGLKLTAGHDDQFSHVARRMRALVQSGYLGGAPVHMESYYCYDLTRAGLRAGAARRQAALGAQAAGQAAAEHHQPRHRQDRGVPDHAIRRRSSRTASSARCSRAWARREIVDELRVIIAEDERTTAYFTFSSQMRPSLHQFRIYGPKNGLILDHDQETLIKLRGGQVQELRREVRAAASIFAEQHLGNLVTNLKTFLARDFHMKSGMKYLIESFYQSIAEGTPVPIPYRRDPADREDHGRDLRAGRRQSPGS